MAIIYINTDTGNDASPDATNPLTPVKTIAEAQSRASGGTTSFGSGDTIKYLNAGPVPVIPLSTKSGISYVAADGGTEIDATGVNMGITLGPHQTVVGFEVHSANQQGIYAANTARIFDCFVYNNGTTGIYVIGNGSEIIRCAALHNNNYGVATHFQDYFISVLVTAYNGNGGLLCNGAGSIVEHVTAFMNNGSTGNYGIEVNNNAIVRNCIALNNRGGYGFNASTNMTHCWSHSTNPALYHVSGNFVGTTPTGSGTTDPMLVNAENDQFGLAAGSPCIHAGTNSFATYDFEGELFNSPPSIGAFEYFASGPDARDRWNPRSFGLGNVSTGWTGTIVVTDSESAVSCVYTPSSRTSGPEIWAGLQSRLKRLLGASWETWADAEGKLTIVNENLTSQGFELSFTGNVGTRLGFASSSYSDQLQYTAESAYAGSTAYGVPFVVEGAPGLSLNENSPVADGSKTVSPIMLSAPVTLKVYDDDFASSVSRKDMVGQVYDIYGPDGVWGRIRLKAFRLNKRGAGSNLAIAELSGETVK